MEWQLTPFPPYLLPKFKVHPVQGGLATGGVPCQKEPEKKRSFLP
jgi:hypothetical protein